MLGQNTVQSSYINSSNKGYVMSEEKIEWISTVEAAEIRPDLTRHTIAEYCRRGILVSKKFARSWMVSKESLLSYEPSTNAGRPRKEDD